MRTATIRHEPAHFNEVAYANIPESWTIFPNDGRPKIPCWSEDEAREVAGELGYRVTAVDRGPDHA